VLVLGCLISVPGIGQYGPSSSASVCQMMVTRRPYLVMDGPNCLNLGSKECTATEVPELSDCEGGRPRDPIGARRFRLPFAKVKLASEHIGRRRRSPFRVLVTNAPVRLIS
jgi:hypothetical protein